MTEPKTELQDDAGKQEDAHETTRHRLLEAAGEAFAEHGFRGVTVRQICKRAHANVAAINYHFGSKEQLYAEVLKYSFEIAFKKYPIDIGLPKEATAEDKLKAYIRSHLLRIVDPGRPAWQGKLSSRELFEPTSAFSETLEREIRPRVDILISIVRALLGPEADKETVRLCVISIVGQCAYFHYARPLIQQLFPLQEMDTDHVETLTNHITEFSLEGIRKIREQILESSAAS